MLLIAAVVGGCAWGGVWAWGAVFGRPVSLAITVVPADATVRVAGSAPSTYTAEASGTLTAEGLAPANYTIEVARQGFEPQARRLALESGDAGRLAIRLVPQQIALTLDVRPSSASWAIVTSAGKKLSGKGSYKGTVPAGNTRIHVTAKGTRPIDKTFFLDEKLTLTAWLDPSGQLVHKVAVFKSVPAPKGLAISPDNKEVWVTALVTQPSIGIFDSKTGKKLGGIDLGKTGAVEVIFSRDGKRAYASQMQSASVYEIDTKRRKVLRKLKTRSSWTKVIVLSPDGKKLYAANWSGDDVSEFDLRSGRMVRRMPTVDTPRGLWPTADGKRLYVAGFGENTNRGRIAVIDLKTGKSKTIFSKGRAMRHMVADEARGTLFTSDLGMNCIWATDMRTNKTRKFCDTDNKPNTIDISPDGKVLFVSNRGANNPVSYNLRGPEWGSVLLIDTHTAKPLDAIIGGNQCTALDVSDNGRLLAFSDFLDGTLRVYEVPPYSVLVAGDGGRYKAVLREVRKDGKAFRQIRSGGGGG